MKPTLHLLGLFHTRSSQEFSHCAFTGKALRFPKMMQLQGYKVIEYSNEGSESTADEHVVMLNRKTFDRLFQERKKTDFYGDNAYVGSEAHTEFERLLIPAMQERVKPGDIICHPFGHAHNALLSEFPNNHHVETGIGYPTLMDGSFKIFESYAWMHYHQGKANRNGINYEWVIPNYFDVEEWEFSPHGGDYIAFLGRICSVKGMDTVLEIAKRSPYPVKIAGQGDPTPWLHDNIEYVGPLTGTQRSAFLGGARCAIMPTVFTEPFGGSGVEAMLCGTPLIAVDYGAFTETIIEGVTGFRCRTLEDWMLAIENVDKLDRRVVADLAQNRYSLEACAKKYDKVFTSLMELHGKGWYTYDETHDMFSKALNSLGANQTVLVVGAMDGKSHDNLFPYLARNTTWKGVLVEPVPYYFDKLKETFLGYSRYSLGNFAIGPENEKLNMTVVNREAIESGKVPEWCNGVSTFFPDSGAIADPEIAQFTEQVEVDCVTFEKLQALYDLKKVDILQIDAEGSDYGIFQQIWVKAKLRPKLIRIEVVRMGSKDRSSLRSQLLFEGYSLQRQGDDWVAVREDVWLEIAK
jgi:FkbM family methyltransferase